MNNKVTKKQLSYPQGEEPTLCTPKGYNNDYRFLLGREGENPLVVIGMNPSAANEKYSDRTVNRIILASNKLKYKGWIVANIYPERATNSRELSNFNPTRSRENIKAILDFLCKNNIKEVWGAWGNLNHPSLKEGKRLLLSSFKKHGIEVYSFAKLTKRGEPVHPLNRRVKQNFSKRTKKYLEWNASGKIVIKGRR